MLCCVIGKSAELLFLTAVIKWRKYGNREEAIDKLDETVSCHMEQNKDAVPGLVA